MASSDEEGARLQGLAEIWRYMVGIIDTMALKCAVELRIADIINSHSPPSMTLPQIASAISASNSSSSSSSSPSLVACRLERFMRLLVQRRLFSVHYPKEGGDPVYGLTEASRWLLHDSETTMAPLITMSTQHLWTSPWPYLAQYIKQGGSTTFKLAHGFEFYELASQNAEANAIINNSMAADSNIVSKAVVSGYKDGFKNVGSLVDVGGGIGQTSAQIVKSYPHIKVTNYDLPHVIATAPAYNGTVSHVAGDMFEFIPKADAIFMKRILHNWSDEDCVKILKNCKKAIPEKTGKLIIIEVIIQPEGKDVIDDIALALDLMMLASLPGAKERTEVEWKKLLEKGGFPSYKIIKIPAIQSIIEAYPY